MEQIGPTDSLTGNRYQAIANHSTIISTDQSGNYERTLERTKVLLRDINFSMRNSMNTTKPTAQNEHHWILAMFWILISVSLNHTTETIGKLLTNINKLKTTELINKLELDIVTMNMILHDIHDFLSQFQAFLRIADRKYSEIKYNQLQRQLNLLMSKGDFITSTSNDFICSLISSTGDLTTGKSICAGLKQSVDQVGLLNRLMHRFKSHVLSPFQERFNSLVKTVNGREVASWVTGVLREIAPQPFKLGFAALSKAIECIPSSIGSQELKPPQLDEKQRNSTEETKEFGTLSKTPVAALEFTL